MQWTQLKPHELRVGIRGISEIKKIHLVTIHGEWMPNRQKQKHSLHMLKCLALSYSPQKLLIILLNSTHKLFSKWMIWSKYIPKRYVFQFPCLYIIEIRMRPLCSHPDFSSTYRENYEHQLPKNGFWLKNVKVRDFTYLKAEQNLKISLKTEKKM